MKLVRGEIVLELEALRGVAKISVLFLLRLQTHN
jgi:hypothetical protein